MPSPDAAPLVSSQSKSTAKWRFSGFCPACQTTTMFVSENDWFRDNLVCASCASVVRERALALVLNEVSPNWRQLKIHESSPAERGISIVLQRNAPGYVGSHWYGIAPPAHAQYRNEDLENQTFADNTFDIVVSLDVMEHLFHPAKAYSEIYRTLKPGGFYIHTFPIYKDQVEAVRVHARLRVDGTIEHLVSTPEFHGSPLGEGGALVTMRYGYDIVSLIPEWAPFGTRIIRFYEPRYGILGEFTDVIACQKLA